jgi:hypothetical protein
MISSLPRRAIGKARSISHRVSFAAELEWLRRRSTHHESRTIAFNRTPVGGAFGGGNQWLGQIARHLALYGWRVRFDLKKPVDAIVLMDISGGHDCGMSLEQIRDYKESHPHVRVIHRLNEADKHRSSSHLDELQQRASALSDYSIFVSEWLLNYHAWFEKSRPHRVIHSGADDRVFRLPSEPRAPTSPFRLVTHHWSNNWAKGFEEYLKIDELIHKGALLDTELWVIGRWPAGITWRSARLFPPCTGKRLASLLHQCDLYVTASRFEAGAMHHVEAAQCGLPVLYHLDSGGTVEVAAPYGIAFDSDSLQGAIAQGRQNIMELRAGVLPHRPSGTRMCEHYRRAFEQALAGS